MLSMLLFFDLNFILLIIIIIIIIIIIMRQKCRTQLILEI